MLMERNVNNDCIACIMHLLSSSVLNGSCSYKPQNSIEHPSASQHPRLSRQESKVKCQYCLPHRDSLPNPMHKIYIYINYTIYIYINILEIYLPDLHVWAQHMWFVRGLPIWASMSPMGGKGRSNKRKKHVLESVVFSWFAHTRLYVAYVGGQGKK